MYPSTQNVGTLTAVIQKIGSHGVPPKFTTKDLPVWGYKSSHDRSVVGVLRFIDFLDGSGVPTDLWKEARTSPGSAVAKGLRKGYADLFATFPDAHRKDAESLTNYFKAKTTVSASGVKMMVSTFKALAQIGEFDAPSEPISTDGHTLDETSGARPADIVHSLTRTGGLAVNMNIELSLPADTTGEVYERFFAAMRKHLIDGPK